MFKRSKINIFVWLIIVMFSSSVNNSSLDAATDDSQTSSKEEKVFVMYAASLLKTFENDLGQAFQKQTGNIYQGEGRGAIQISNMIIDGQRTPDVFVSAGTIPIWKLMNNTTPLADWLVKFGSAEIVIAYSPNSRFFSDLEKARAGDTPWYQVLSKQDFKFGRTDPELDPKGYYMTITAELANLYYNDSGIKQRILGDDRNPKQIFPEEILKTVLEQGQLDAVEHTNTKPLLEGFHISHYQQRLTFLIRSLLIFTERLIILLVVVVKAAKQFSGNLSILQLQYQKQLKIWMGLRSFVDFMLSTKGEDLLEKQGLKYIKPAIIQ